MVMGNGHDGGQRAATVDKVAKKRARTSLGDRWVNFLAISLASSLVVICVACAVACVACAACAVVEAARWAMGG
jgi:hypothetical protein